MTFVLFTVIDVKKSWINDKSCSRASSDFIKRAFNLYFTITESIERIGSLVVPSKIFISEIFDLIKKIKKNDEEEKKQKYLDELKEQIKKELSNEKVK